MRSTFTLFLSLVIATVGHAQLQYWYDFDAIDSTFSQHIFIDTTTYQHNLWQVGKPQKTVFDLAHSQPNVMVTDTVNPYIPNDTSVFIAKFPGFDASDVWWLGFMQFHYQLDIDSTDIAMLEVSTDSTNWTVVTSDSFNLPNYSSSGRLNNTNVWTVYQMQFPWGQNHGTYYFRFTFISDSINSGRDGWEIDDIYIQYQTEGVSEVHKINLVQAYPNPCQGSLSLKDLSNNADADIRIYSIEGRKVFETKKTQPTSVLDLPLPNGQYIMKYQTKQGTEITKVVIRK